MMLAAEITQMEIWMLISNLLVAIGTLGALVFMVLSFNKKQRVAFQQPVTVTITEELHKTFAAKSEFDAHVLANQTHSLEVFREINRLKSENLQMTRDIGQITAQTMATLANAKNLLKP